METISNVTYLEESRFSESEIKLSKFFMEYGLDTKTSLVKPTSDTEIPEISNGGDSYKWLVPVALGVAGFFTGGATWAAIPAAISGVALGMTLVAGLEGQDKKRQRKSPTYTFSMAGTDEELAKQGDVLPVIYCNRVINPKGGVRYTGKIVASRVINVGDSGYLNQVVALSLGRLGSIDLASTLINGQPLDRFFEEDIDIEFLPGSPSFYSGGVQTGFENEAYRFLGHTISPSSFNLVGVNLRALAKSAFSTGSGITLKSWQTSNCFFNSNVITKNAGVEGEFDAFAYTGDNIGDGGGSFSWRLINSASHIAGFGEGLSPIVNYGFKVLEGGTMEINVFDTTITEDTSNIPFTWNINDVLKVDLTFDSSNNKVVNFIQNSVTILSVQNNWSSQSAKVVLSSLNKPLQIEAASGLYFPTGNGGVTASNNGDGTMELTVFEDDRFSADNYERFTPAELYSSRGGEFRVIKKIPRETANIPFEFGSFVEEYAYTAIQVMSLGTAGKITGFGQDGFTPRSSLICRPNLPITEEDGIYAIWTGYYQTLRKCNEVTFNLDALIFSRPKPEEDQGGKK